MYQLNALPRTFGRRFIQPIEGVVVSQADHIEPGHASVTHQLRWSVCPVRHRRMRMQVNPHTSDLSRCHDRERRPCASDHKKTVASVGVARAITKNLH
jgi:hypothetical protein